MCGFTGIHNFIPMESVLDVWGTGSQVFGLYKFEYQLKSMNVLKDPIALRFNAAFFPEDTVTQD